MCATTQKQLAISLLVWPFLVYAIDCLVLLFAQSLQSNGIKLNGSNWYIQLAKMFKVCQSDKNGSDKMVRNNPKGSKMIQNGLFWFKKMCYSSLE